MVRSSLAQSLAALNNVAPDDFDPEAGYDISSAYTNGKGTSSRHTSGPADSDVGSEEEDPDHTAHYQNVTESKLRKRAQISESDTLRNGKYAGVKSSVKELYANDDDMVDEEDGSDDDDEGESGEDAEESEEESRDEEEDDTGSEQAGGRPTNGHTSEAKATLKRAGQRKGLRFASPNGPGDASAPAATLAAQSQADAELLESLKSRARSDAIKGRAVRRQQAAWEKVLQTRILAQKVCGRPELTGGSTPSAIQPVLSSLASLSHTIFALRVASLSANHPSAAKWLESPSPALKRELEEAERAETARATKRARTVTDNAAEMLVDASEEAHARSIAAALSLETTTLYPLARSVLDKWSSKVHNTGSSGGAAASLGLKAVNQSAGAQVSAAMEGDGLSRLTDRTRVWRGVGGDEGDADGSLEDRKANIFDDSDFYSHLLKELIESRGAAAGQHADHSNGLVALQNGRKKKRSVDTKASKGRRIKYEIHPKLEAFMPPIPRVTWNEDQFGKLLAQLAGLGQVDGAEDAEEDKRAEEGQKEEVQLAGLRLFG